MSPARAKEILQKWGVRCVREQEKGPLYRIIDIPVRHARRWDVREAVRIYARGLQVKIVLSGEGEPEGEQPWDRWPRDGLILHAWSEAEARWLPWLVWKARYGSSADPKALEDWREKRGGETVANSELQCVPEGSEEESQIELFSGATILPDDEAGA